MHIIFTPMRRETPLTLEKDGDCLIVNGERFDFSDLPEGALLPPEAVAGSWLAGSVTRQDGVLSIPVILPHGARAPAAARVRGAIRVSADGPIPLPAYTEV